MGKEREQKEGIYADIYDPRVPGWEKRGMGIGHLSSDPRKGGTH